MEYDRVEFDLAQSLIYYLDDPVTVPCTDADPELLEYENDFDSVSNAQIAQILDPIIDSLAMDPGAITKASVIDTLQYLLKNFATMPVQSIGKVLDTIVSGLAVETDIAFQDIESADGQETIKEHRELLEIYGFLLQWAVTGIEARAVIEQRETATTATAGSKGKKKGKGKTKSGSIAWDSATPLQHALETMCKVLKLKLLRIFVTTSERDRMISLFTRPAYLVLENEERVKSTPIRMHIFKLLCIAVKHHGHAFGAQTSIIQNLSYFEHLSEPMAEFLQILCEQYDHSQLVDEIIKELSNKEFNSNDTKGPKSVSMFLVRLSLLVPRQMIKNMTVIVRYFESESYNLRSAVIEICGNLIVQLSKDEGTKAQQDTFFELLNERFLDVNPYCRCKALQVYHNKLLNLETNIVKHRQKATELACQSLHDKSSHVRKNAIKLLTKLLKTHPYGMLHGGTLKRSEWQTRLESIQTLDIPGEPSINHTASNDNPLKDDASDANSADMQERSETIEPEIPDNREAIIRSHLTKRYYIEALKFIDTLHAASETVAQLLSAKNKSEVIEAMDFFQALHSFSVETSNKGIKKMLRLIWTKGNSDEGKGIQAHLIEVYKNVFLDAPDTFSENETANFIARNLISLTFDTTSAELTSLEQLVSKMMNDNHISDLVVRKLWAVYGSRGGEVPRPQRRGAVIVLGMLALADPEIVVKELETLLRVGLGSLGRADAGLAKYTCVALKHIRPSGRQAKGNTVNLMGKLPSDHAILIKLAALAELQSTSHEWFGVAEQALGAIYALAKHPDAVCTDIIRRKTKSVFESRRGKKYTLYFSRRLCLTELAREHVSPKVDDELELIGGTTEDDFTEAMVHIRERELLYGDHSILTNFGPLAAAICGDNVLYKDRNLQAQATLCMAKLMCVSSEYCEEHIPLLITIMERSADPITRSNAVIALGDMAVCFNHLIDENTDFLYRRLNDADVSVKRTCLMTLTFLILAGQVKVKGQLGEMAKCLEDPDKRIADLAKMFFTELSTKDNAVYNHFVDMFSLLSAEEELKEDALKRILKFLASFVEKDKHAKQLAEKLAARLPRCETERQWNDVAYVLSLLQHKNEDIQKIVAAGFRLVQTTA
ncbi:armadillo-type protein [Geopyxis carbonaria]|nr:armadillo-type protein [Geopyxis carbonaria]